MIEIGRFQIDVEMRTLRRGGEVVPLGSRAFDILSTVASADGRLVTKDEIMSAVWPETVVEENNIQVHVSALRKILGPDRNLILTVPGRGYQLLKRHDAPPPNIQQPPQVRPASAGRLPHPKTNLVGRHIEVAQILAALRQTSVLTLVGAGGIGKTSLAIEAAGQAAPEFSAPVCFVELAALTTREAILREIVASCGLPSIADGELNPAHVSSALTGADMLLLLDNAEHVAGHVAEIVELLVSENEALRVLVTSREPLRIMPETVLRVDPLDVPPPHSTDAEILQRSAVNLFLLRARSIHGAVGATSTEIQLIGEICRRLDGIPLALELAAARVLTLGVEGVHRRLDDRMAILAGGYRTALPRHQTLRATFDWSFALLDASTQSLFRRLATFGGVFTFEAMCAIACDSELTIGNAIISISELAAKSLVNVEFDGPVAKYRLAECTRAYASEKLQAEGEAQQIAARHARYLSTCFKASSTDLAHRGEDGLPDLPQTLDDACSASDWAFSADGDPQLGVELASNLAGTLLALGRVEECCTLATRALDALERLPAGSIDAIGEMRVRASLAAALSYVRGPVWMSTELWRTVLTLATESGAAEFHARALCGLWNAMLSSGKINESMQFATQFQKWARSHGTVWQQTLADQLIAVSLHCLGRHAEAKDRLEDALQRLAALRDEAQEVGGVRADPLVFCKGTLARIVWLQGDPEQAMMIVDKTIDLVRSETMEPSLTHMIGTVAVPLALMSGDLCRARHYLDIMRSQAALHHFDIWREYSECLTGCHDILNGHVENGLTRLEPALDALLARGFRRLTTPFVIACAEAQVVLGQLKQASARLHGALDFCRRNGELLFVPEIRRALGSVAQAQANRQPRVDPAFAEKMDYASACFLEAIDLSRAQGARMWELRSSIAMARLLRAQDRSEEALELLETLTTHFKPASTAIDIETLFGLINTLRACDERASGECLPALSR
ncbi:ATP-binding protein [Paraburkholderia atlantica]|uniref:ATP-binding protein n=1 Tax=Paraburkholderia atlantica TaxID=2654982 RepID=UPI00160D0029|nr:winged helix-turn-helix domain-containing protein [Paraburkholderia atlantica]MBB5510457.1 putative ATPase/DNA-binding winged helix-turn-helix (wHTH) protein [Paraburkholderia atlantica]